MSGLSLQVVATRRSDDALDKRLDQLEQVVATQPSQDEYIKRAEAQLFFDGFVQTTQEAINNQSQGLLQLINEQTQNEQAKRVQEARKQVMQPEPAMSQAQIQQMYSQVEQLTRQING